MPPRGRRSRKFLSNNSRFSASRLIAFAQACALAASNTMQPVSPSPEKFPAPSSKGARHRHARRDCFQRGDRKRLVPFRGKHQHIVFAYTAAIQARAARGPGNAPDPRCRDRAQGRAVFFRNRDTGSPGDVQGQCGSSLPAPRQAVPARRWQYGFLFGITCPA